MTRKSTVRGAGGRGRSEQVNGDCIANEPLHTRVLQANATAGNQRRPPRTPSKKPKSISEIDSCPGVELSKTFDLTSLPLSTREHPFTRASPVRTSRKVAQYVHDSPSESGSISSVDREWDDAVSARSYNECSEVEDTGPLPSPSKVFVPKRHEQQARYADKVLRPILIDLTLSFSDSEKENSWRQTRMIEMSDEARQIQPGSSAHNNREDDSSAILRL